MAAISSQANSPGSSNHMSRRCTPDGFTAFASRSASASSALTVATCFIAALNTPHRGSIPKEDADRRLTEVRAARIAHCSTRMRRPAGDITHPRRSSYRRRSTREAAPRTASRTDRSGMRQLLRQLLAATARPEDCGNIPPTRTSNRAMSQSLSMVSLDQVEPRLASHRVGRTRSRQRRSP